MDATELNTATLHHPHYTDVPIWLRITGVEHKNLESVNVSNVGRRPPNARIDWGTYEEDMLALLEQGLEPPEIAASLGLPRAEVSAKCARMVMAGEVIPGWRRKR